MFSCCRELGPLTGILEGAFVTSATVDKSRTAMKISLFLRRQIAPVDVGMIEDGIRAEFGLDSVSVTVLFPRTAGAGTGDSRSPEKKPSENPVIYGKETRGSSITPMETVTLELGKATVRGEVFDVQHKEIAKRNAWVMTFDMTDYTGSVHVSKFLTDKNAGEIVGKIKKGMFLTVSGNLAINRFDGELTLEPVSIVRAEREKRQDSAETKRVELHLHTKMSAMDAVTDTAEVIRRAIDWGHPAIAVTDHGVAQSFPDAMKAAGDKIKVIYGLEGYYINDVDDRLAVCGGCSGGFDGEIVVFDIETTGLKARKDAITEIGAVVMKDGRELDRFQTFADPGMRIPANITQLTGISDNDVRGAPSQEEAVQAFLTFARGRILCAHNAGFDIGFIDEACRKYGLCFEPRYLDTLALSRALLPDLKGHRLNNLADFFSLPDFNHHRASDDAVTAGFVLTKLFERLKKDGITDLSQINTYVGQVRAGVKKNRFKPKHIILLARTQAGVKNLYKLITKSHLDYFSRYPIIPKSQLILHRDGLLIGSACESGEVFSAVADGDEPPGAAAAGGSSTITSKSSLSATIPS